MVGGANKINQHVTLYYQFLNWGSRGTTGYLFAEVKNSDYLSDAARQALRRSFRTAAVTRDLAEAVQSSEGTSTSIPNELDMHETVELLSQRFQEELDRMMATHYIYFILMLIFLTG